MSRPGEVSDHVDAHSSSLSPPGLAAFSMIAMSGRAVEPLDPAGSGTYSTGT